MTKKTILMVLCLLFLFSCGKKADPEYKETKIKVKTAKIS